MTLDREAEPFQKLCGFLGVARAVPGGLSEGTRTSAFRKSTSRWKFASIKPVMLKVCPPVVR